jgi:hypothetical protein
MVSSSIHAAAIAARTCSAARAASSLVENVSGLVAVSLAFRSTRTHE